MIILVYSESLGAHGVDVYVGNTINARKVELSPAEQALVGDIIYRNVNKPDDQDMRA